jgi:hypothetical protein
VTPDQLLLALSEQSRTGRRLGELCESLGLVPPGTIAALLALEDTASTPTSSAS